ncbi:MAG: hypothetical protein IJ302_08460, partial [Clostridia bacterium]|nr:hypothetical protein [Clostridia bacterium]
MICITYQHQQFSVSCAPAGQVVSLQDPAYLENGCEASVPYAETVGDTHIWRDDRNEVTLTVETKTDTLFRLCRTWKNLAAEARNIQTVLRVAPQFSVN